MEGKVTQEDGWGFRLPLPSSPCMWPSFFLSRQWPCQGSGPKGKRKGGRHGGVLFEKVRNVCFKEAVAA